MPASSHNVLYVADAEEGHALQDDDEDGETDKKGIDAQSPKYDEDGKPILPPPMFEDGKPKSVN